MFTSNAHPLLQLQQLTTPHKHHLNADYGDTRATFAAANAIAEKDKLGSFYGVIDPTQKAAIWQGAMLQVQAAKAAAEQGKQRQTRTDRADQLAHTDNVDMYCIQTGLAGIINEKYQEDFIGLVDRHVFSGTQQRKEATMVAECHVRRMLAAGRAIEPVDKVVYGQCIRMVKYPVNEDILALARDKAQEDAGAAAPSALVEGAAGGDGGNAQDREADAGMQQ